MFKHDIIASIPMPIRLVILIASLAYAADVLTQHNDLIRSGANLNETILTPANVNAAGFGKLFDVPVDGQIYAQPLVVAGLNINGQTNDVVYVATAHNSLYAIDANTGRRIWRKGYGTSMSTPSPYLSPAGSNSPYRDMNPEIGITSTPVIDRDTGTLYFTNFVEQQVPVAPYVMFRHYLHAVALADGAEKFGGPVEIAACVTSPSAVAINQGKIHRGRHRVNTQLCFDPMQHLQRPALLLVKPPGALGQVILGFGSHADYPVFHGWVMSYQADNITKQLGLWVSNLDNSPEGSGGGIWQSGMGFAVDDQFNFFLMTGNGPVDDDTAFGESFLRFSTAKNTIARTDSFTPCNQEFLDKHDVDLGSSGPLLLIDPSLKPVPNYVVGGGKQGRIYVLNKDNLGGKKPCALIDRDPQVVQEFQAVQTMPLVHSQHIHGSPLYWNSKARGPAIYVWGESDKLRAYPLRLTRGRWLFDTSKPSWTVGAATSPAEPWAEFKWMMTGGMLSLSANGDANGIVWATTPTNNDANPKAVPGILRAYDATDLSKELWNSYQNPAYDDFGNFSKFTPVTVANGKVYVPTFSGHLSVYGLRSGGRPPLPANLIANGGFENGSSGWTTVSGRFATDRGYAYYGKYSGVLCTAMKDEHTPEVCPVSLFSRPPEDSEVAQTLTAPKTGRYTLSARCATNILPDNAWIAPGESVTLGVDAGSLPAGQQVIRANAGYLVYTIDFDAQQGQPIRVWYSAPGANIEGAMPQKLITPEAWAVIDDVTLIAR